MKKKIIHNIFIIVLLTIINACTPNTVDPPIPNPLNGKVKKMTTENGTTTVVDFFYDSNARLDSIILTDSTHNIKNTTRYSFYTDKIVSKVYTNGITNATDSSVYYISSNRLDSIVNYVSNSRLLKTYHYDNSGTLTYFKNYLNNSIAEPTNTIYSNGNLISTNYTFDPIVLQSPFPYNADTTNYNYSSQINNLVPDAFGLNFSGLSEIGYYTITNSRNLVNEEIRNIYTGNTMNSTIVKVTINTTIAYAFDSQNRVINDTRTITYNGTTPQLIKYTIEYY